VLSNRLPAHHAADHQPRRLWDESQNFYPRLGGIPHLGMREWRWPRAGKIKFAHLPMEWQADQEEAARKKESCSVGQE
jgi:hypothetical protein